MGGNDTIEAERARIGQGRFKEAASSRDPQPLINRLLEIGLDDDRLEELAELVRNDGSLIFQRADTKGQATRDAFLDALRTAIATNAPELSQSTLDGAIATIRIAERGHQLILGALARAKISTRSQPVRLGAAVARSEARLAELRGMIQDALAKGANLVVPGGVPLADPTGRPISADALMTSIVEGLGGTLKMEGHAERLFGKSGVLELPALPAISENDVELSAASEALGMAWLRWERFHQKARTLDQDVDELTGVSRPAGCPDTITTVFARGEVLNLPDWIANERALDRENISHSDLLASTSVAARAAGIDGPVPLPPAAWISSEEVSHCLALSEAIGYEVAKDYERPGGLRLVQWIRGYSALVAWAQKQAETGQRILHTTERALADLLGRLALTEAEATTFLNAVSFGRSSRDLFDAPIVRTKQGWLVIGAAVSSPRLARIIPSLLSSKDIQLKRKGSAFEQRVLEFLKGQGLDARQVKVFRDGAEYQFDALVPWGDKLLLLECKNHGLSGNDPVRARHFLQGLAEDIEQVQRLANGLVQWPKIVTNEFGPGAANLEIVPILLQNETFNLPGPQEGVYIYDWSALTRFFEAGWFRVAHDHKIKDTVTFRNRVAIKRIWQGDKPTAEDLLAELAEPHQIVVLAAHARTDQTGFQIDEQTYVIDWVTTRLPMTIDTMVEAVGGSVEAVRATLKAVDDQIIAAKAKLAEEKRQEDGDV